jgi:hypothetical protein
LGRDLKNLIIHLVELQYLNNLKCWAILEWFSLLTMIPGFGRSEVVTICPDTCISAKLFFSVLQLLGNDCWAIPRVFAMTYRHDSLVVTPREQYLRQWGPSFQDEIHIFQSTFPNIGNYFQQMKVLHGFTISNNETH